jgi:hypothetical protein
MSKEHIFGLSLSMINSLNVVNDFVLIYIGQEVPWFNISSMILLSRIQIQIELNIFKFL